MAIALTQGHVQRAIEFYNKAGKFFVIGGTLPWDDEASPESPVPELYKLRDIVAYKRVDNCYLVVPDDNGTIHYRTQNWRIVVPPFRTTLTSDVNVGSVVINVESLVGIVSGAKLRIGNKYEAIVEGISGYTITLSVPAPEGVLNGAVVEGGALVEGAKYVYIDCYLNYDEVPLVTYRQIGVCSEVAPDENILKAAEYSASSVDEFTNPGVLEIIDNRVPSTRDIDQKELLSLIIEM